MSDITNRQRPRFSPGPPPSTPRGKRRHEQRTPEEQKHAKSVWIPKDDWLATLASQHMPKA